MIENRRVLVVVPARGGSKGLPGKNLRLLGGVPLVEHAARVVRALGWIDRAIVSTDDQAIAKVAEAGGLTFLGSRPPDLSGDRVADLPVLQHGLHQAETADGVTYDIVVMLQPTSPLRRPEHVEMTVRELVAGRFDSVWTVSPTDVKYHPLKQLRISDGGLEYYSSQGRLVIARQQLDPVYHRNGVAYAFSRTCLIEQQTILGRRAGAVVIAEPLVSIDTAADLEQCEHLLQQRTQPRSPGGLSSASPCVSYDTPESRESGRGCARSTVGDLAPGSERPIGAIQGPRVL